MEQLRLSTVDMTGVPTLANLQKGVQFTIRHQSLGHSVYVHCKAGRSRSATMVAAYLIQVGALFSPSVSKSNLIFILLFLNFYLLVALGPHCRLQAFSNCCERGLLFHRGAHVSHCGGFFFIAEYRHWTLYTVLGFHRWH